MKINKTDISYIIVIITILAVSIVMKDNIFAIIASLFGAIYTILLGRGKPEGYIFGIIGTTSGIILSYSISLWGNCLIHALYFLPMEVIGLFAWKKNFSKEKDSVIKTKLTKKESLYISLASIILYLTLCTLFTYTKDGLPYIDALITVLSLTGMYLTVKRCYEQWIIWTMVNIFSVVMWFKVYAMQVGVFSILTVRLVYLGLGIYFLIKWREEINNQVQTK